MDLMSAREFLHCQTLTDSRSGQLKAQCKEHSKSMSEIGKKVFNHKTNEFLKIYVLSEEAKAYVKEEFKQITNHIMVHQKGVNTEMAKILKEKTVKEENRRLHLHQLSNLQEVEPWYMRWNITQ